MTIVTKRMDFRWKPKLSNQVKSLSDAEVEARAKADKDNPPLTDQELAELAPPKLRNS